MVLAILWFGAEYVLRKDCAIVSDAAIITEIILPFGSSQVKPEKFLPKILVAADQDINSFTEIDANLGTEYVEELGKYVYDYSVSIGLNISNRVGGFIEVFGQAHNSISANNYFDFGLTYLQSKNVQLDWYAGTTLQPGITN